MLNRPAPLLRSQNPPAALEYGICLCARTHIAVCRKQNRAPAASPRPPGPGHTDHTRKTCVRLCDCVRHMCVMRHESCPRTKGACTPKGMQRSRVPHCAYHAHAARPPLRPRSLRPPRVPAGTGIPHAHHMLTCGQHTCILPPWTTVASFLPPASAIRALSP